MSLRRAACSRVLRSFIHSELGIATLFGPNSSVIITPPPSPPSPLLSLRTFSTSTRPISYAAEPIAAPQDEPQFPPLVTRLSLITEPYHVQPRPVFAVVEIGGTQYKVTPDDVIVTEKIADVDVNDKISLNRILLVGSAEETVVGRPYVPDASVIAAVEEQFLDGKVISFYKRRRKNSRRLRGHRQPLTTLRILDILGI